MGKDKDKKQEEGTPGKTKKSSKKHLGMPKLSPPSLGKTPSTESDSSLDSSTPSPLHFDPSSLPDSSEMQLVVINGTLYLLRSCWLLCFPFGAILTPSSAKQLISLSLFSPIDTLSLPFLFLLLFSLSLSSFPSSSLILPPSFSFFPLSFLSLFFFPFSHFSSPLFSPVFFLFSVLFGMLIQE